MQAPTWSAALHAALRYVITSEITAVHKATLIEALTRALRDHDARRVGGLSVRANAYARA